MVRPARVVLAAVIVCAGVIPAVAQLADWVRHADPRGRFSVEYPSAWGAPLAGTNDGFGNRVAALRFQALPGIGNELALIRGRLTLDMQALGGLYDAIALEGLPAAMQQQVLSAIEPATLDNLCRLLATADHLGTSSALPARTLAAARLLDRARNIDPRVVRCDRRGNVIVFHKEATFETPTVTARQHIFGAMRVLPAPDGAVHLVRVMVSPPSAADLDTLARVVQSFSR